ncbi:transmembrane protein 33 homolog [Impatiens glandulifera]|uniref:transmembrane protein 33 homolog n=1 Tax=Impatiens glandulifera TaxID=253017 RepID=UPI001FB0D352|nr:transmembrane protein 33 homolog [Impatiens glandulifera]
MGEEEDHRQMSKRIAAAAYDYERDPRWADYWSNILIPPQMASLPNVVDHFKHKFYQRFIDPDLVVEAMTPSTINVQSRSSATRVSGPSTTHVPNPTSLRWDQPTIQFSVNAWVFIVAVLAILPVVPINLSNRAYKLSFMGTTCSSLYSLYTLYGKPRAWNLQAVQVWFQSVVASKDFIYSTYCVTFLASHLSLKFALIPIICRALEHAAKFLRRNFRGSSLYRRYLDKSCVWVEANTTNLSVLSSHAEIGLGFLLIISLFSWQRNIIQTFMYWKLLKLMYHAPVTAGHHQSVWAKIGRTLNPSIQRYAPFLTSLISAVQRWWFR